MFFTLSHPIDWFCYRWVLVAKSRNSMCYWVCASVREYFPCTQYFPCINSRQRNQTAIKSWNMLFSKFNFDNHNLHFCVALSRLYTTPFFCVRAYVWVDMHALLIFSCTYFWEASFSVIEGEKSSGNIHPKIKIYYRLHVQLTWLKAALLCSHSTNW